MNLIVETYDLWNIVMVKRSLRTLHSNPIIVQIKALIKRAFQQHKIIEAAFYVQTQKMKERGRGRNFASSETVKRI